MKEPNEIIEKYKNKVSNENFKPPIDLEILKEIISNEKGMEIILEPLRSGSGDNKTEAILIPLPRKFVIKTKTPNLRKIRSYRDRMSVCHEFAHILYYKTKLYHDESRCFRAARELLVPEEMLKKDVQEDNFMEAPLTCLRELCKGYEVSKEVMAYRLSTDTSLLENIIITFWIHKNDGISQENLSSEDFKFPRSFLSSKLTKSFSVYWRRKLYKRLWEVLEENNDKPKLEGKTIVLGTRKKKFCRSHIAKQPLRRKVFDIIAVTQVVRG